MTPPPEPLVALDLSEPLWPRFLLPAPLAGFLAEPVSGQQQPFLPAVPQRDREHADKPRQAQGKPRFGKPGGQSAFDARVEPSFHVGRSARTSSLLTRPKILRTLV